jgi:hypothetical protein
MLVIALLVTPLAVSYIPRARQSLLFDRMLWVATPVLGFLGAWFALGYLSQFQQLAFLNDFDIGDVPVMTALIGAVVGEFGLNLSLWVLDRFARPAVAEETSEEEPGQAAESDDPNAVLTNAGEEGKLEDQS